MVRKPIRDEALESGLRKIDRLLKQDKALDALDAAIQLQDDYPQDYRVHLKVADAGMAVGDSYIVACEYETLVQMSDNPLPLIDKAVPYFLDNGMFATALVYLSHPLCISPSYLALSREVRALLEHQPMLAKEDLQDFEALAESELVREALNSAELSVALSFSQDAVKEYPNCVTVRCAHGRTLLQNGLMAEAIEQYEAALKISPDALLPLASLVRAHIFNGNTEAAHAVAQRIRANYLDIDLATCLQTLGLCGDFSAVLDVYAKAKIDHLSDIARATIYHIVAVAHQRTGKRADAEKFWRKSTEASPDMPFAADCLADQNRPAEFRNGAWVSGSVVEMPRAVTETLMDLLDDDSDCEDPMPQLLEEQSWLKRCFPWMLMEGDEQMVRIGLGTALSLPPVEVKDALLQFAAGLHGGDELRIEAYRFLVKTEQIATGPHPIWVNGELVSSADFSDVFDEEDDDEIETAEDILLQQASEQIDSGEFETARVLINEVIEIDGENCQARIMLAQLELVTGNVESGHQLMSALYSDYPDEPGVAISMAHVHVVVGKSREARVVLNRVEEEMLDDCDDETFAAFCEASIMLSLQEGNVEAASNWLEQLEEVDPESSFIEDMRKELAKAKAKTKPKFKSHNKPKRH